MPTTPTTPAAPSDAPESFIRAFCDGRAQLVTRPVACADLLPLVAFRRVRDRYHLPFFLESATSYADRARNTVIGLAPDRLWRVTREGAQTATVSAGDLDRVQPPLRFTSDPTAPIESLRAFAQSAQFTLPADVPDAASGIFGYLGYDLVRHMERLPETIPADNAHAIAMMVRPTLTITFDLATAACLLHRVVDGVTDSGDGSGHGSADGDNSGNSNAVRRARDAWTIANGDLDRLTTALQTPRSDEAAWDAARAAAVSAELASDDEQPTEGMGYAVNMAPGAFCEKVEHVKAYIRAGDAFQVVISQRLTKAFDHDALAFYAVLREVNPSPYLFFFEYGGDHGGFSIAGSSPEVLVRASDGVVTIRPLAGTRKRGKDAEADAVLKADLLSDPKERAEHMMLLDLGRNDVGRVSVAGGVRVVQQFEVEFYSAVMHIVSQVEGRMRPDCDAIDALVAGFPAGTLSGAPKIRAMEIIEEVEPNRRGVYSGGVGYISASGNMDTCIAIRTAVITDGKITVNAGAGVVADSVPQMEDEECWNKARALLRAATRVDIGWDTATGSH